MSNAKNLSTHLKKPRQPYPKLLVVCFVVPFNYKEHNDLETAY